MDLKDLVLVFGLLEEESDCGDPEASLVLRGPSPVLFTETPSDLS